MEGDHVRDTRQVCQRGAELARRHGADMAELLGHDFLWRRIQPRGTSEEALRDARYQALVAMARECGARMVLTAHPADDNLETILFRMLRGTGPRGLCGIPEGRRLGSDLWVVRPFLQTRRHTLHQAFERANAARVGLDLPALVRGYAVSRTPSNQAHPKLEPAEVVTTPQRGGDPAAFASAHARGEALHAGGRVGEVRRVRPVSRQEAKTCPFRGDMVRR